jgi:hypothetical protein
MQAKRMDDSADVRAVCMIISETHINTDDNLLQLLEEKDDWLQGIRALKEGKSWGLENRNLEGITLSEAG